MPVRNITKPECDCSVDFEDYDAYRIDYCPLHARAAEMREILDDLVDAIEHEMEVSDTAVLPNVITQLAQARALLEETR